MILKFLSWLPTAWLGLACCAAYAQPVSVAELTLKLPSGYERELYYGFAAGDEILFLFNEVEGKKIKEVDVSAWPNQLRYADYETAGGREQRITVPATGVYRFRFRNTAALGERVVQVSIRRRPADEQRRMFDTNVQWEERQDTFYRKGNREWPGWTDHVEVRSRKILTRSDTSAVTLLEKTERIHSRSGMLYGGNTAEVRFRLPANQYLPDRNNPMSVSEVISWAYWIGVGDEADRSYQEANLKALGQLADLAAGLKVVTTSSGYGALALLALKGVTMFSNPPKGDNVRYTLWNDKGKALEKGNSIVAYKRVEAPLQGDFLLQLENDNVVDGINVTVKVLAIIHQKQWRMEDYTVYKRVPLPPDQRDGQMQIRSVRIPRVASN